MDQKHVTPYTPLSRNIIREVSVYFLRVPTLLWVNEDHMLFFDLGHMRISPPIHYFNTRIQKTVIQKDEGSRWALVDSHRVVMCGGGGEIRAGLGSYVMGKAWSSAYLLYTTSSEEQVLPNMLSGHCDHGIVVWKGTVLVFGLSTSSEGRKCERLALRDSQWTNLPLTRWDFIPVVWQEAVFLCGATLVPSKYPTESIRIQSVPQE